MRRRRSFHRNRTPSQTEGGESSDLGAFERKPTKGREDNANAIASAKKGTALFMAKSQVPTTGPASRSVASSVLTSTPLLYSSASDGTRSGTAACSEE